MTIEELRDGCIAGAAGGDRYAIATLQILKDMQAELATAKRIATAQRAELDRIRNMTGQVIHTNHEDCVGCGCMALTAEETVVYLVAERNRLEASVLEAKNAITFLAATATPRSPQWPRVRATHLKEHPTCAACGSKIGCEVHHLRPYHLFPHLELDPANLLTLCDRAGRSCHLTFGHLYDWSRFNARAVDDAARMLERVTETSQ